MRQYNLFQWFRKTAIAEGISFLVLLFIAMPLKYFAASPTAVTIVGGLHGVLFVVFVALAWIVKKDLVWFIKAFIASLLPFGTIIMDKHWRKEKR
jgi:integral membrane protein